MEEMMRTLDTKSKPDARCELEYPSCNPAHILRFELLSRRYTSSIGNECRQRRSDEVEM